MATRFVLSLILVLGLTLPLYGKALYPLPTAEQQIQFNQLLTGLRCLMCQNQDLADSNASLAVDLRQQVYQMVKQGKNDKEIMAYLSIRYGDFILFKPPLMWSTALLWLGPVLFLILGLVIFWFACLKQLPHE